MLTPLKNLGANLLTVFAIGGVWAVGYLVTPMLEQQELLAQAAQLRLLMMVFALLGFVIALFAHIKSKSFDLQSTVLQMNLVAVICAVFYFIANHFNPALLPILYGVVSVACLIWVAYLKFD